MYLTAVNDDRLVQPLHSVVAPVGHHVGARGRRLRQGRVRLARHAKRHEQRPGVGLQLGGVRLAAPLRARGTEHGRQGPLVGQRADGEVVQDAEVGVPEERGVRDTGAARRNNPWVRGRARLQEALPVPRLRDALVAWYFSGIAEAA